VSNGYENNPQGNAPVSRGRLNQKPYRESYSISYLLSQSVQGFWRNRAITLATIFVLTLCIVATGSFFVLSKNINLTLKDLGKTNELVVYINETYSTDQVKNVGAQIEKLQNVTDTKFISKETALNEEKEKFKDYPHLFDGLEGENNPYRDSYVVTYKKGADISALKDKLQKISGIEKVVSKSDIVDSVTSFKNAASFIFFIFAAGLYIIGFFVIITTIKQTFNSRRQEITVMRYVGATDTFIRIPFIIEGAIIGLISGILSSLVMFLFYSYILKVFSSDYKIIKLLSLSQVMPLASALFIVFGVMFAALGSFISIRKISKV